MNAKAFSQRKRRILDYGMVSKSQYFQGLSAPGHLPRNLLPMETDYEGEGEKALVTSKSCKRTLDPGFNTWKSFKFSPCLLA